jgi:NAD+ kinase
MTVAVYGRPFSKDFVQRISDLFRKLEEYHTDIIIYKPFLKFLSEECDIKPVIQDTFEKHADITGNEDIMLSIGGDGTFLETVTIVQRHGIPIAGINAGRLGFLSNIPLTEIESSLDAILKNEYSIEDRSLISLGLSVGKMSGFCCALNDVSLQKKYSSMITIHAYLNDVLLNSYWADGLIISTPTGSTAYSMSVGGPIVTPDSNNFIISPLAPHNLAVRPVIVPDNNTIRLKVNSRESCYILSLDSRTEIFDTDIEVLIKRANFTIKTVRIKGHTFYDTMRNKLMWGVDKRN